MVVVTDSPFGAFVGVRRRLPNEPTRWQAKSDVMDAWLARMATRLWMLWHLLTDDIQPCRWRDVGDTSTHQARARGGDLITVTVGVTFVNPGGQSAV
jgi:hypothetical protein